MEENECVHRHVYPRLYHGPGWRRQLPGADLRNSRKSIPRDRAPFPVQRERKREKESAQRALYD